MAYRDVVLNTSGLLSYWDMQETSGTTVNDSQSTIDGTIHAGVTLAAAGLLAESGDLSYELELGAGHIGFGNNYTFLNRTAFSVELWMHPRTLTATFQRVINKDWFTAGNNRGGWNILIVSSTDLLRFVRHRANNATILNSPSALSENTTYHIVGTYDGTTMRMYINGVDVANESSTQNIPNTDDYPLTIGRRPDTAAEYFDGFLGHVAIYDRALTALEVEEHYDAGTTAGGAIDLDGTSDGSATVTGILTVIIGLSGTSDGAATVTGELSITTGIALTGTATGVATGAAALAVERSLAGTAAGESTVSGTLDVIRTVHLDGQSDGTAATTGALNVDRQLSGISAGQATATGDLAISGQTALDGSAAGSATVSGSLTVRRALTASSSGQATSTGVVIVSRGLSGQTIGQATVDGELTVITPGINLDGVSSGTSAVNATLHIQRGIAGVSDGRADVTGLLVVTRWLTGSAAGAATVTGVLILDNEAIPLDMRTPTRVRVTNSGRTVATIDGQPIRAVLSSDGKTRAEI